MTTRIQKPVLAIVLQKFGRLPAISERPTSDLVVHGSQRPGSFQKPSSPLVRAPFHPYKMKILYLGPFMSFHVNFGEGIHVYVCRYLHMYIYIYMCVCVCKYTPLVRSFDLGSCTIFGHTLLAT